MMNNVTYGIYSSEEAALQAKLELEILFRKYRGFENPKIAIEEKPDEWHVVVISNKDKGNLTSFLIGFVHGRGLKETSQELLDTAKGIIKIRRKYPWLEEQNNG